MLKLSIIVPVYNVEKYVERCLMSCVAQDIPLSDFEMVVINDGSKDQSLSIVESFAKEFDNIRIYSQRNEGLSAARNKGLSVARGEYVWFVDSDDFIKENCLSFIVNQLNQLKLDALLVSAANVGEDGVIRKRNRAVPDDCIYTGRELVLKNRWEICVPFTIYRRGYLQSQSLQFMYGVYHEDTEFTPKAYYGLKRVAIYNEEVYFVRQNPNSITRTVNPQKSLDLIKVCNSLSFFAKGVDHKYAKCIDRRIVTNMNTALLGAKDFSEEDLGTFKSELELNKRLFLHYLQTLNAVFIMEGLLFYISPKRSIGIYHFFNSFFFKRKIGN